MKRNRIIAGGVVIVILIAVLVYALTHDSSSPAKSPKPAPLVHPKTSQGRPAAPKSPSSNGSNSTAGGTDSQVLSDTGPGDIALLFGAASVAGYACYLGLTLRRQTGRH